jgi:GNAT superfamily N-acetyltransferase
VAIIREPQAKDLMHFTRYAIEFFHHAYKEKESDLSLDERLLKRKYWAADRFTADRKDEKLLVAEVEDKIVGYILGTIHEHTDGSSYGLVDELFVDEYYRREGIGTELCRQLIEWMNNRELTSIQMHFTSGHPRTAAAFIEAVGFTSVSALYKFTKK